MNRKRRISKKKGRHTVHNTVHKKWIKSMTCIVCRLFLPLGQSTPLFYKQIGGMRRRKKIRVLKATKVFEELKELDKVVITSLVCMLFAKRRLSHPTDP